MLSYVLVAVLLTEISEASFVNYSKCSLSDKGHLYDIPQYVIDVNKILTLNISASQRPSHQIVSHILQILLTEALGYKNVSIIPQSSQSLYSGCNATRTETELSNSSIPSNLQLMVNLEVWLPPGLSLDNMKVDRKSAWKISSAGPLGPVAQYGFFVQSKRSNEIWNSDLIPMDHYRFWTNKSMTEHHKLGKAMLIYQSDMEPNNSLCTMKNLIKKTKLVKFPIVEKSTKEIMSLYSRDKGSNQTNNLLILFTWFPNAITSRFQFQRVSFSAPCSLDFSTGKMEPLMKSSVPCDPFPMFQMTKWVWSELKRAAPPAYSLIQKLFFSQTTYEEFLRLVDVSVDEDKSGMYRKIACKWLQRNKNMWRKWLPKLPKRKEMRIGGIFPIKDGKWYDSKLLGAFKNGVKYANEHVLNNSLYTITYDVFNISCGKQDEALYSYNQIVLDKCGKVRGNLLGVLAASCSESIEPMILLNKHYQSVIISPTVESGKFTSDEYPYFFRTVPDMAMYNKYLIKTFKHLKWGRVALFRKDDHFVKKLMFDEENFTVTDDFEMAEETVIFENVKTALKKAKDENNARIFIIEYFEKGTSLVLCAAAKLGMTASRGYVWFLNPWISDNFLRKTKISKAYEDLSCTKEEMFETIKMYFVLTHLSKKRGDNQTSVGSPEQFSGNKTKENKDDKQESKYAPYVRDAVLVFAHAMKIFAGNDTLNLTLLNSDSSLSPEWNKSIPKVSFEGLSGFVEFDKRSRKWNDDRPYELLQYQCDSSENCSSVIVGAWAGTEFLTKNSKSSKCVECEAFYWFNRDQFDDGGSESNNCFWPSLASKTGGCAIPIIVVVLIPFLCVILIICLLIVALRPHYIQLKEAKRQLAPFSDILNDLQPLELKSFQIVLNLPLGEGAFGTVRGGEAKLDGQWHAVAVKTLHERATQDEKMEFLSEARIMKAFNHRNIVKLLGVRAQSKSEPYMTVMEFMLYGDMKKYLIARHVLAKEEPQHQDISPSSLTSMTVDIVTGLSYLHELGYIHRDLALRNCLVGNNRQVKLCDFGLTRRVNDGRDYYRFERRGMLPVRWMAPESLHSGVFTIKSDIWSFGVVLYEIVTFGNKPYRDKRNEDVIDCMRLGNDCLLRYLNRPEENLPKLLTLMRECFHYYPHERPDSAHILNYLLSDPCCVRPCLEEVPPDPGELPAGLLGPDTGDRRRGGSGGGNAGTDRIRFHSGRNSVPSNNTGFDSVFIDQNSTASGLAQHSGLNSSFPPHATTAVRSNALLNAAVNGARNSASSNTAGICNDVRNYASTELIPMRSTRSLSGGLGEENSLDNASPTTGLLETEISLGSDVDALAACDYDAPAVTFSPFANGATPHSRASVGLGSSLGSLHSRMTHAS